MKKYKGRLALHSCVLAADVTALKKLLAHAKNINRKDNNEQTPLHLAALKAEATMVLLLKDKGANPSIVDCHGAVPLHLAAQQGYLEVVKALIDMGSQINIQDRYGNTPLHLAVYKGHLSVAKELLARGANPNLLNNSWLTALAISLKNQDMHLVRALKKSGGKTPKSVMETIKLAYLSSHIFRRLSIVLFSAAMIGLTCVAAVLTKGELALSILAAIFASIGFAIVCLNAPYQRMRNMEAKIFSGAITQTEVDNLLFAKKKAVSIKYITDTAYIEAHNDNEPVAPIKES